MAVPNYIRAGIPIPSGLNIQEWRHLLVDREVVDYLEYGWPADYTADKPPTTSNTNYTSDPHQLEAIRY